MSLKFVPGRDWPRPGNTQIAVRVMRHRAESCKHKRNFLEPRGDSLMFDHSVALKN